MAGKLRFEIKYTVSGINRLGRKIKPYTETQRVNADNSYDACDVIRNRYANSVFITIISAKEVEGKK